MLQHLQSSCPLLKTMILKISGSFERLFECLPALIETVSLSSDLINEFVNDSVDGRFPRELPTPLFHLKYLSIDNVCFTREEELILALLIKSSPNMEKLKILDGRMSETFSCESSSRIEVYSGIMLEHLNELEIEDFINHDNRFDFVKLILARSPVLKKVRILPKYHDEKLQASEILLGFSRASPEVQIIVADPCYC